MSTPPQPAQRRTRNGCKTCKKRRKRCDEVHPVCGNCTRLNIKCEYGLNVRWGSTRESFVNSVMPQTGLGVGPKDALYDLLQDIGTSPKLFRLIDTTLDGEGRAILLKFLTSGYRLLASDFAVDDSWLTTLFPMCEASKACLLSMLAFETAVEPQFDAAFERYYDQALTQFTKEICGPHPLVEMSLYFAGLFMCTVCLSRLMPWTMHLNPIISLARDKFPERYPLKPHTLDFFSTMGYLDLETHTINRMTQQHYLWENYCKDQKGVHRVSGLPFSLLDLLGGVHKSGVEQQLAAWTPPDGAPAQQLLWKATKFAGIISAYELKSQKYTAADPEFSEYSQLFTYDHIFKPEVLVGNILSLIHQCMDFVPEEQGQFKQTLIYPLVMAASQRQFITESEREFVCTTISSLARERNKYAYDGILRVIRAFWEGDDRNIGETARRLNIELALM